MIRLVIVETRLVIVATRLATVATRLVAIRLATIANRLATIANRLVTLLPNCYILTFTVRAVFVTATIDHDSSSSCTHDPALYLTICPLAESETTHEFCYQCWRSP